MSLEQDNAYFAEDSNFCQDCHEPWSRCQCAYCVEHGCYFVECGKLGHGEHFDKRETL